MTATTSFDTYRVRMFCGSMWGVEDMTFTTEDDALGGATREHLRTGKPVDVHGIGRDGVATLIGTVEADET